MTDTALARCHICAAVVPDRPEDRRDHVDYHRHTAKQTDALARELRAYKNDLTMLRAEIDDMNARKLPDSGIRITDIDADEFDDDETDPELIPTIADPLAGEPAESAADLDDEDDLELPSHPVSPYA